MIPFLVVKTRAGFAYVRPSAVLAVNSSDPSDCSLIMTGGVVVEVAEPAEDVVQRLEAESREEDDAALIKENRKNGHFPR